jgi:hypothetical protein
VGELSGTAQSGVEDSRQLLLAASYNVSKRLTLDAGAAKSLRRGDSTWSAFAGLTWLAARCSSAGRRRAVPMGGLGRRHGLR